jgi:hypothetical protein
MLMGREGRFPRRCYIFAALLAVLHLALAWRGLEAGQEDFSWEKWEFFGVET